MNHPNSIIPDEMRGVQKIAGYRGKGKSWYVSTVEDPELTVFFDNEKKGEGIDNQLDFGLYVPVTERATSGIGIYDVLIREIKNLPQDKYTHVIIDNTAPLETAMKAEAARNAAIYAKQFGMDANNIIANKYGGQSGVVNYLISDQICNPLWAKGVKLISVTSHVKPRWAGGTQVPNSYNVKGADRFDELSVLTLILIQGEFAPIPSAIVYKEQLGSVHYNKETKSFTRQRRLPYRLPKALPEVVVEYLSHPADLVNPAPGEVPTDSEIAPFKEELTKEQYTLVLAELEREKKDNSSEVLRFEPDANIAKVKELSSQGMTKPLIAKELNLTIPQVIQYLSNGSKAQ